MAVEELCKEIEARRAQALERRIKAYPRNNPIASDLGPCTREMVLSIKHWQERPLFPPEVKARLERGNLIEDAVLSELAALGIRVRVERTPFQITDKKGRAILRGKVDGFVSNGKAEYPMEVKSMTPFVFEKINSLEDFSRYWWTAKYPRQLQSYLYANNLEEGFFLLDNLAGHWKPVPVTLDYEEMEKILQQCEQAVDSVNGGPLPDYHTDPSACLRCWAFGKVCEPPIFHEGMAAVEDPELEQKLNRRGELEPAHREYEAIDKNVKQSLKGKTNLIVGNWLITGQERNRKGYEVKPTTYWQSSIDRITDDGKDAA